MAQFILIIAFEDYVFHIQYGITDTFISIKNYLFKIITEHQTVDFVTLNKTHVTMFAIAMLVLFTLLGYFVLSNYSNRHLPTNIFYTLYIHHIQTLFDIEEI